MEASPPREPLRAPRRSHPSRFPPVCGGRPAWALDRREGVTSPARQAWNPDQLEGPKASGSALLLWLGPHPRDQTLSLDLHTHKLGKTTVPTVKVAEKVEGDGSLSSGHLRLSEPQFPQLQNGDNKSLYLPGSLNRPDCSSYLAPPELSGNGATGVVRKALQRH